MSLDTVVDGVERAEWQTLTSSFADHNIYQTWEFGTRRAAEMRGEVSRLVVRRRETTLGLAQARIKRIPLTGAGVALILRGPLWRRQGSYTSDLQAILEAIHSEYAVGRGLALRVIPNIPDFLSGQAILDAFERAGLPQDPTGDRDQTSMLDLSRPLDELRRGFAQKWRNCLNQSAKRGLTVHASTDDQAWAEFEELYEEMMDRKQFQTGVSVKSFRALQRDLAPAEKQMVLLACLDDQPVAGHVSSTLGDTCIYLLGASNEVGRKHRAAYLLQWHAIQRAKEAGALWYDLGGIDPEKNPGTYRFKAGVGGRTCGLIGPFRACTSRSSRYLVPLAERLHRARR